MVKVSGNDVIIRVFDDASFKPVACSTSCSLEVEVDTIEKLTVNSGVWSEPDYQSIRWRVTVDNIIILDDAGTKFNPVALLEAQVSFLKLLVQFSLTDGTNDKVFTGNVLVASNVFTGPVNEFARHQCVLQGSGAFTISNDLNPPSITIAVTGTGTGSITALTLTDPATSAVYTYSGVPIANGSSVTWTLDGAGSNPPAGSYYITATVTSDQLTNHFSTNAPPAANVAVGSGTTNLNSAPFGSSVLYDFTADRTITFTIGS